jgi:hypothetical protein
MILDGSDSMLFMRELGRVMMDVTIHTGTAHQMPHIPSNIPRVSTSPPIQSIGIPIKHGVRKKPANISRKPPSIEKTIEIAPPPPEIIPARTPSREDRSEASFKIPCSLGAEIVSSTALTLAGTPTTIPSSRAAITALFIFSPWDTGINKSYDEISYLLRYQCYPLPKAEYK